MHELSKIEINKVNEIVLNIFANWHLWSCIYICIHFLSVFLSYSSRIISKFSSTFIFVVISILGPNNVTFRAWLISEPRWFLIFPALQCHCHLHHYSHHRRHHHRRHCHHHQHHHHYHHHHHHHQQQQHYNLFFHHY